MTSVSRSPESSIWIFGAGNGRRYNDNSRALFEHVRRAAPDVRPIWLTKKKEIVHAIRLKGGEAHLFYSPAGIALALRARVLVISTSFLDLPLTAYLYSRRSLIIQLWHGTPFKVLENMQWSLPKRILLNAFLKYVGRDCDAVVSSSSADTAIYQRNFKVEANQVWPLGQPRNDALLTRAGRAQQRNEIWYMPTFREYERDFDPFAHGFDRDAWESFLEEKDAALVVNFHQVDRARFTSGRWPFVDESRIRLSEQDDVYEGLAQASILITDYSSVYFDFLLLDRPIVFAPFDLEQYEIKRGFYYDYDEVTPGPKTQDWPGVMHYLDQILDGTDDYAPERARTRDRFNLHQDTRSSERITKAIKETIHHSLETVA